MTSQSDSSDNEFAPFSRPTDLIRAAEDRRDRQQLRACVEGAVASVEARSAPTPEQDAGLRNLETGEGAPLALAKILRPAAHLLEMWPLPDTPLVRAVRGLVQLPDIILADVESGGTPLDQAVFLGHYAQRVAFDGPERRADFHKRAIAELKSLDPSHTEQCGSLSGQLVTAASPRRCQACYEYPIKQCELRIVEEVAGTLLNEQKSEQRRARAEIIWHKPVWPAWAVLSWIVFRDRKQICAVELESEFNAERLYDQRWRDAETAVLSALQADRLQAVKDRKELPTTYWYGVLRIEPDTWFQRDRVLQLWPITDEWDGFLDAYWTLGQTILWIVTRDSRAVDDASNDSGRLGEIYGQAAAAAVIEKLKLPGEQVQHAADELRRRCLNGALQAFDDEGRPIDAIGWRNLKISLDSENVPFVLRVGQSSMMAAYRDVVFSRVEALLVFPPTEPAVTPEPARADTEPPVPPKRSDLAKKSDEHREPNVLEIAKPFVKDGIAPSVREHTTLVMSVLKKEYPGNHPKRERVSELLTLEFKNQRRSRGRTNRPR